jgi:hypothetical protein
MDAETERGGDEQKERTPISLQEQTERTAMFTTLQEHELKVKVGTVPL